MYCVAAEHAERWHCEYPIRPSSSTCPFNLSQFSNSSELSVTAVCVLNAFSLSYKYQQTKCSQTALYKNSMRCFVEPELLFHILNGMKCLVKNLYIDRKGSFTGFGPIEIKAGCVCVASLTLIVSDRLYKALKLVVLFLETFKHMEGHQEEKHTSSSCQCQRGFEIHAVWQRLFRSDHCLGRGK